MEVSIKEKVLVICEHCGASHDENTTCACVRRSAEEKRKRLLEEKKNHQKRYRLRLKKSDSADQEESTSLHPLLVSLLKDRGIEKPEAFVRCPIGDLIETPMLHQEEAEERIFRAIKDKEPITIYGDYDADGVTSVALGLNLLRDLGATVDYYINNRFSEGFGIGKTGVEELAVRGTRLIITADNGIAGHEAIARAKELGMEVLVTDHHEPNGDVPHGIVVDPKQPGCPYPNKNLVGVAVLFKILHGVCKRLNKKRRAFHELDLVALGTVTDVAPLLGENRILVKNGLKLMNPSSLGPNKSVRPGILALRQVASLSPTEDVNAYHLGFIFGPMINAEGRLDGVPDNAVRLLTTSDPQEATELARKLRDKNDKRKKLVEDLYGTCLRLIDPEKKIFVLADASFDEGVVGLLAGRLKQDFYTPAIVLGIDKQGRCKGSGRSREGFNLKKELDKLSGFLVSYGGHEMACGLTIEQKNMDVLKNLLETQAQRILQDEAKECIRIDAKLSLEDISLKLVEDMALLEPFGEGFPRPKFLLEAFEPLDISLSKSGLHTRMKAKTAAGIIDVWAFGQIIKEKKEARSLIGFPLINEFRGRRSISFRAEVCASHIPLEEQE